MSQKPPTATDDGQLFACVKSAPVTWMSEIASGAAPVLVSLPTRVALRPVRSVPKASAEGASVISGAVSDAPVPLSESVCGLPAALLLTTIEPVAVPAAWGRKLMVKVQVAFGASVDGPQP